MPPQCEIDYGQCLHWCTFVCYHCSRNCHRSRRTSEFDCWEPEEAKRDDGIVICDICGHPSKDQDSCQNCGLEFSDQWTKLPKRKVPLL